MPSYYIWTIGCQMNHAESERLVAFLVSQGYTGCDQPQDADLIIINGCVVRESAENRVVNKLHQIKRLKQKNPGKKIIVTGCYVSDDLEGLRRQYPFVDVFCPAGEMPALDDWVFPDTACLPLQASVSSYIPIIQGCDNFCSYCIVPYRRGRERSRPVQEIILEAETLVARGACEIILLGQNVDSYGHDLPQKPDLAGLLEELNQIKGLQRLRFLTNHPKDMSERLINAIARLDKVCEQINLPVQAGHDEILAAMCRGYSLEKYKGLVRDLRAAVPGISITTDIIVGFPGEKDYHIKATLELLQELCFDAVHIAMYSARPQTMASARYQDDITADIKQQRRRQAEALQAAIATEINRQYKGLNTEVLVEGRKKGKWYGRNRNDKLVFFEHNKNWLGKLVDVKINKTTAWSLSGTLAGDEK